MKPQIFLSASIPTPGRKPFDEDIQIKRIRDAVLALVTVCRDRKFSLTFGGHPAISPLVHHAAESLGVMESISIYQSEFYREKLPEAAWKFPNLRWTEAGPDDQTSQNLMRDAMINPKHWQYDAAVFIGGMEGIYVEAQRFHLAYPEKVMIPLRSTGGASRWLREVLKEHFPQEDFAWHLPELEEEATSMLRYRRLLDRIFAIHIRTDE